MAKTCHKNMVTLSDAGKKVFLEVSFETKDVYVFIYCAENVRKVHILLDRR